MAQQVKRNSSSRGKGPASKGKGSQTGLIVAAISLVVVVAVVATLVLVKLNSSSSGSSSSGTNQLASPSLVAAVTGVPNSALASATVPAGSITMPYKITGGPTFESAGKPVVLYMGADYCPYCAAERWPLIIALSKFGTFKNLHVTSSSSSDVYPNTQTFSFYGSSYSSPYIDFQGVEMTTNKQVNGSYPTLMNPTPLQQKYFNQYDKPPYTSLAAGIPFIDFANKYIISGPSYSPGLLAGLSRNSIAGSLTIQGTVTNGAILPSANLIIATICKTDGNQPGSVCSIPAVKSIEASLK